VEPSLKKIILTCEEFVGQRLDRALGSVNAIGSRSRGAAYINAHRVRVNGKIPKPSLILALGDTIEIQMPDASATSTLQANAIPLDIIFEDKDLLIINKMAGMVVHPSLGHENDTLVNALVAHTQELSLGFNEMRPGIVHRIDRDTSGLLVIAKNDLAHRHLADQFRAKTTHRKYWAIVYGEFSGKEGTIESFLSRHPHERKRFSSVRNDTGKIIRRLETPPKRGKWSVTHFRVEQTTSKGLSLLHLNLETGRTHQIRVHLSEAGHPIVGDVLYGGNNPSKNVASQPLRQLIKELPRFALHAAELGFNHPHTGEFKIFRVGWPQDLKNLLEQGGFSNDVISSNS
jgi:23S rRNA pseudouridine1911/1915/1917 synthase